MSSNFDGNPFCPVIKVISMKNFLAVLALLCPGIVFAAAPATLAAPSTVTGSLSGTTFTLKWSEVTAASGYNIRCAASDTALTALDASDPSMTATPPTVNGTPLNPNTVTSYPVPNITAGMSCEVGAWSWTATASAVSVPSAHVIATAAVSSSSSSGGSSSGGGSSSSSSSGGSSSSSSSSGGGSSSGGSSSSSGGSVTLPNGTAVITWTAPTTNTDGSAIPASEVLTYNVYEGTVSPVSLTTPLNATPLSALTCSVTLAPGTYYFAVVALNGSAGSGPATSPQVIVPVVTVIETPSAPGKISVTYTATTP
jgi:hypothetical protein